MTLLCHKMSHKCLFDQLAWLSNSVITAFITCKCVRWHMSQCLNGRSTLTYHRSTLMSNTQVDAEMGCLRVMLQQPNPPNRCPFGDQEASRKPHIPSSQRFHIELSNHIWIQRIHDSLTNHCSNLVCTRELTTHGPTIHIHTTAKCNPCVSHGIATQ